MAHVALVGPEIEENLSLRYIASSLARAGHTADLVPFNTEGDFASALHAIVDAPIAPVVVGISLAFQWRARDFLALAMALRDVGYRGHITVGGHFATFEASNILADFPEIDSVCRQESEETFVNLTEAVAGATGVMEIPGLALRTDDGEIVLTGHPPLPDLSALPRPDRRGDPASCLGHGIAPLVSSRGCYANCTFCCIAAWHEQSLPGKRYRLREVDEVADEMLALKEERGVDVFVFHDDNFFVPGHKRNVERFTALADALDARGIGDFATVVKARPTDVSPEVFTILKHRLKCIRVYVGVETDADQGLRTLRRWAKSKQNHSAMEIIRSLDLYTCFNVLLFDPDTTLESIETNLAFMEYAADCPFNFGRVELYAGTPLLARMQQEKRCRGDWMQWDYDLGSPAVERVFDLSMQCFGSRNFGNDALANRIMGTRFDVEVARHFHPDRSDPGWLHEAVDLTRTLGVDSALGMRRILEHVRAKDDPAADEALVAEVSATLRATEVRVAARARALARAVAKRLDRGAPLTDIGDRVATPLQNPRAGWDAGAIS